MHKKIFFVDIVVLMLLTSIYYYIIYFVPTDIPAHANFIVKYFNGTMDFPTNFLYYLTIYFFSAFSNNINYLLTSSWFVLVAITFLKYVVSKKIILQEVYKTNKSVSLLPTISAALLLFCFSLPSVYLYFGKFYIMSSPPNVWHNSTTIFVMPFVLLLFWYSLKQLENYNSKRDLLLLMLLVLNIIIKPSFIFVYIIAYPILLLSTYGFNKIFFRSLLPLFAAGILIILEYYLIYVNTPIGVAKSSVKIDFMHLFYNAGKQNWFYTAVFFGSTFVSSFLFPIVFMYRNKQVFKEKMVQFAIVCTVVALLICNLFYETGLRETSGNFLWQNFMCTYLLFLVCLIKLFKLIYESNYNYKRYKLELGLFVLHFIAGIIYFFKIFLTSNII